MAIEWYHTRNGQKYGPFTEQQFKQRSIAGILQPNDLVWKTGATEWVPASRVQGLFPRPQNLQPPISASAPMPLPTSVRQPPPVRSMERPHPVEDKAEGIKSPSSWLPRNKWVWIVAGVGFIGFVSRFTEKPKSRENALSRQTSMAAVDSAVGARPEIHVPVDDAFTEKFKLLMNRVTPGMTQEHVEGILGTADETDRSDLGRFNPQKAGQTLTILTWKDGDRFIKLGFTNGLLTSGGTPGYDINKGFHGQLPSDLSAPETAKLKKTLEELGFQVDDK